MSTALLRPHVSSSTSPGTTFSTSDSGDSRLSLDGDVADTIETPPSSPEDISLKQYERQMGNNELSYFLPSRADGVNDMCVCLLADELFI
jgi:hypothetical protein